MSAPRAEWRSGHEFHEFAEALGIRTVQIMAVSGGGGTPLTVIYSPEVDENDLDPETPIFGSTLKRDDDGILKVVFGPVLMEMNWAELQERIEAELRERFGDLS